MRSYSHIWCFSLLPCSENKVASLSVLLRLLHVVWVWLAVRVVVDVMCWWAASCVHHLRRVSQLVIILLPQLHHSVLSIQLLSNFLICTHKLVNLSRKLIVLVWDDPDVVIHRVNLNLQVSIALNQWCIRVLASFKFALQVHNLVLLASNFDF